ncbi:MAG: arginine--tRNA ligase [Planctomycetes bacterium]|nr:arginine--tRNA ligase [Planctomycetota bacterium]
MQEFIERIRRVVARHTGLAPEDIKIESPRDALNGDLAFPCFQLAKRQKQPPPAAAVKLGQAIAGELTNIAVVAAGPYLNFRIERSALALSVLGSISVKGAKYGGSSEGAGQTIVLDYSSPNIAKPMHVGHIRSTIIGAALQRLHAFLGYRTVGVNHLGDWGAQFGALVVAIRRWRETVELEKDPVAGLLELYQRSKKALDEDEEFKKEAVVAYQELESGKDGEVRALWRWVTEVSMRGFDATYARLGIQHDLVRGESFYEPLLEPTLQRVQAAGVTEVSQGALVVQLGEIDKGLAKTPCLLRQTNGTTLYATRDLAALFQRWEEFQFARCLYVVGAEQKLHFRQLKAVLARMGCEWASRVEHVDFGLLLGPGRVKLASRKGEVLVLDDLIDEIVAEARAIIAEKNPELPHPERIAEQVGLGAIVFNDLKRERIKDVVFDKAEILAFEGETGPYVQYTHARLGSILRKAPRENVAPDWARLEDAAPILLALGRFPGVVAAAAENCEPSELAQYLLALSRTISSWLAEHKVLDEDPPLRAVRLLLVQGSQVVLKNGLTLLGVGAPDEM